MKKSLLSLAAITLAAAPALQAATFTWADLSTDFNATGSWTTVGVPGASDNAAFPIDGAISFQPNVTAPITLQQVRFLGGNYTLSGSPITLTSVGSGTGIGTGSALLSSNGTNTVSADIVLGAAGTQTFTTTAVAPATTSLTVTGNISSTVSSNLSVAVGAGTSVTISGTIGSTVANFSKTSATGTLTLSSADSSYVGTTTISGGVLEVTKLSNGGVSSSIGASSSASTNLILNTGTLRYIGTGDSTDRLIRFNSPSTIESSGTGALKFTNTGNPSVSSSTRGLTLGGTNTDDNTLAWTMLGSSGVNPIVKTGSGKWILTGANTYTLGTTVSAGTLIINGSHTNGGNYVVDGTLGGIATIGLSAAASTTVNSTGVIAPGANTGEIGTLTFNGSVQTGVVATFNSGASFTFDLNATSVTGDRIALINGSAGDLVFGGNVINFNVSGDMIAGQSYTLFSSNVANAFSGLTFSGSRVSSGLTVAGLAPLFSESYIELVGNDLVLQTVIPEPTTWLLLSAGLLTIFLARRRRVA